MYNNLRILFCVVFIFSGLVHRHAYSQNRSQERYDSLQHALATGWNTWNTRSVLSHVLMPDGIGVNLGLKDARITENRMLTETYISHKSESPENIIPGMHAYDGSYTDLTLSWKDITLRIETSTVENDLYILITPVKLPGRKPTLFAEGAVLWNSSSTVEKKDETLVLKSVKRSITFYSTQAPANETLPLHSPYLSFILEKPFAIYSGPKKSIEEIASIITSKRYALEQQHKKFGNHSEVYAGIQASLSWNMIYDASRRAVVTPVSRYWNTFFGGNGVLFCWDTYFAAYLASLDNKALAYANIVEVTRSVRKYGMVPNYVGDSGLGSPDRSQPPIGSIITREVYRRHGDKWLLELVFDDLLTWNQWWPEHRSNGSFLSWGSDYIPPPYDDDASHNWQGAAYESGLDNSPMFDGVPFNKSKKVMELADVGLISLYIADCKALAEIAQVIGKPQVQKELLERADLYSKSLKLLWNKEIGMYLNLHTDTGKPSTRVSPTNFYPLLAGVPSQKQAEEMINKFYFNKDQFYGEWMIPSITRNDLAFVDQNYWRGRIWAPLNMLVYMGIRNYHLEEAQNDLASKSRELHLKNWNNGHRIHENFHGVSGQGLNPGEPLNTSDSFYHWGALNGLISLIEAGLVEGNEKSIVRKKR